MDGQNEEGSFSSLLQTYVDIAKLVIGLASGSIILIIGSILNKEDKLPVSYETPLYFLFMTILFGLLFIIFLTLDYESFNHNKSSYTKFKYSKNIALGWSTLICFVIGYFWLLLIVI